MQNCKTSVRNAAQKSSKCPLLFRVATIAAILLLAAVFSGCNENEVKKDKSQVSTDAGVFTGGTRLLTIKHSDSCEYILWDNGYGSCMLHSGNCHNAVHQHRRSQNYSP